MTDNLLTETTKPDHVPDKFWDAETGEVRVEAMMKSYAELERKMSNALPAADSDEGKERIHRALGRPESADEYCVDCSHGLFEADSDVNQRLHAKGLTQEQLQEVYDLAAEKIVPMMMDMAADFQADREVERLINHFGGKDSWKQVSKQLMAFGRQNLAPDVFENLSNSFEGVMALYRMMKSEEPGLAKRSEAVSSSPDDAELQSLMRDPKYWRDKDPSMISKVTEGFKTLYSE